MVKSMQVSLTLLLMVLMAMAMMCQATSSMSSSSSSRIIGGEVVDPAKHPYLVSIRNKASGSTTGFQHRWAGVIYSERIVITAAQTVLEFASTDRIMVVAAATTRTGADGMQYLVAKAIAHPSYSFWTVDYDVGLLFLEDAIVFDQFNVRPIAIGTYRPAAGKMGTIAGWGYREEFGPSSYQLEETHVPIVSAADCEQAYGVGEVTERMICAGYLKTGGKDACQGDTGGPLVVNGDLIGLVSWGRGCARPNYPGVYTYVPALKQWIDETIAANN